MQQQRNFEIVWERLHCGGQCIEGFLLLQGLRGICAAGRQAGTECLFIPLRLTGSFEAYRGMPSTPAVMIVTKVGQDREEPRREI